MTAPVCHIAALVRSMSAVAMLTGQRVTITTTSR